MEDIKDKLILRQAKLQKWKEEKEKALLSVPDGTLRINNPKGNTHYYHRTNPKDFTGKYISKKDMQFIKELAQKEYDQKVLRSVENELKAIDYYCSKTMQRSPEEIYESLHEERKKLVVPITIPKEEFVRAWESKPYEGKGFDDMEVEFYTARGERVRSKSEVMIAEILEREGIPYRYEAPVMLKGWGYVYPDFTVLHVGKRDEIYWEHFGMMDNPEYAEHAVQKIEQYEKNGIFVGDRLILTYETKKAPMHRKKILRVLERYFKS